jgi:hypothetical protein
LSQSDKSSIQKALKNSLDRGVTQEQLQDFIDRARAYWMDNPEMIQFIDDMEVRYISSFEINERDGYMSLQEEKNEVIEGASIPPEDFQRILKNAPEVDLRITKAEAEELLP